MTTASIYRHEHNRTFRAQPIFHTPLPVKLPARIGFLKTELLGFMDQTARPSRYGIVAMLAFAVLIAGVMVALAMR